MRGTAYLRAKCQPDGLMAQTHTQQRQSPLEMPDHLDVPDIGRMPWSWSEHAEVGCVGFDTLNKVGHIVAFYAGFQP